MTENEALFRIKDLEYECINSTIHYYADKDIPTLQIAIKALEEIQQYRAIGTVEQLEWCKDASHWKELFKEKLEQYEAIGTIEEFKALKENQRKCEDCAGCTNWLCDCSNERAKAIDEFVSSLIPRLPDAIYPKDVESMTNLINETAEQMKEGV